MNTNELLLETHGIVREIATAQAHHEKRDEERHAEMVERVRALEGLEPKRRERRYEALKSIGLVLITALLGMLGGCLSHVLQK